MPNKRKTHFSFTKKRTIIFIVLFLLICATLPFYAFFEKLINFNNPKIDYDSGLITTFIDVGQGDAIMVNLPDDKLMLIDSGSKLKEGCQEKFESYINKNFKQNDVLDYVVLTHSHEDHAGNMPYVFNFFQVNQVYKTAEIYSKTLSGNVYSNTETFKNFTNAVANEEGCECENFYDGLTISGEDYSIKFHTGNSTSYANANNYSPIIILEHLGKRICLTGDAEKKVEDNVLSDIPECDILKLGHHGSSTSSSLNFLEKVLPTCVVISVGENSYGHPTGTILSRVENLSSAPNIFRTDQDGSITVAINETSLLTANGYMVNSNKGIYVSWFIIAGILIIVITFACFMEIGAKKY